MIDVFTVMKAFNLDVYDMQVFLGLLVNTAYSNKHYSISLKM